MGEIDAEFRVRCQNGQDPSTPQFSQPFNIKIECTPETTFKTLDESLLFQRKNLGPGSGDSCTWEVPIESLVNSLGCLYSPANDLQYEEVGGYMGAVYDSIDSTTPVYLFSDETN